MDKKRILIIDDEKALGASLKKLLDASGYQVSCCSAGKDGVDLACRERFDVVLLDIKMDDIDGVSVLKRISNLAPQTRVIIITGSPSGVTIKETLEMGACDYIMKPFDHQQLIAALDRAFANNHRPLGVKKPDNSLKDMV